MSSSVALAPKKQISRGGRAYCAMSGTQHIHCGQLGVGAEGGRSRDGSILRTPQHIWDYGCYNARCTAGREALQPLSGVI